jgi:hypothetical protein
MSSPHATLQSEADRKRADYWERRDEIKERRRDRRLERKRLGTLPRRKHCQAPSPSAEARRVKSEYDARRYAREKEAARKQSDSLEGLSLVADNWFSEYNYKVVAPSGRITVERGRFDEAIST